MSLSCCILPLRILVACLGSGTVKEGELENGTMEVVLALHKRVRVRANSQSVEAFTNFLTSTVSQSLKPATCLFLSPQ